MDNEGFHEFLLSQGLEPRTIKNYFKTLGKIEADLKRLTGHSLDTAEYEDLRKCMADYRSQLKPSSCNIYGNAIRKYLVKYRGKEGLDELLKAKRITKRALPQFLREEEVKQLMEAAGNLRDRLILELLWETGCRPGELLNIRIRDVQFDNYSAIINLSGKMGDRLTRVFIGRPDLIEYMNDHPHKGDPEAHLIVINDIWHRPLGKRGLNKMLTRLGLKTLNKNVYPYMFRHGCFTEKSKFYTDRELKLLGGWTGTQMLETYSHLNQKDVDDKTLQLHGLKPPQNKLSSLIEVKKCSGCQEDNAPFSLYCRKCNRTLEEGLSVDKLIRSKEDLVKLAKALDEIGFKITGK